MATHDEQVAAGFERLVQEINALRAEEAARRQIFVIDAGVTTPPAGSKDGDIILRKRA